MIKFDAKLLAAVALAQSTDKHRHSICGVYLDGQRAVATDGHVLNVAHDAFSTIGTPGIYPISKKAITAAKKPQADMIEIAGGTLVIYNDKRVILHMEPCVPIDAEYPDYKRIVPTDLTDQDEIPAFTTWVVNHLTATAKIVALSKTNTIKFIGAGDFGANVVRYDDPRIFSVVMPCRSTIPTDLPEWF